MTKENTLATHDLIVPIDDMGWKSKLKIPPKDNRFKTSVST